MNNPILITGTDKNPKPMILVIKIATELQKVRVFLDIFCSVEVEAFEDLPSFRVSFNLVVPNSEELEYFNDEGETVF